MTELTVSGPDRDGVIVEMEHHPAFPVVNIDHKPMRFRSSVTLSPDEARAIATQLIEAADQFEADEYRFASHLPTDPR